MSDNTAKIIEALALLEVDNDEHWTGDGMPRVSMIEEISGLKGLKRGDITGAAPNFTRENVHVQPGGGEKPPVEGADNGLGVDLHKYKTDGDVRGADSAEPGSQPGAPDPDAPAPAPGPAASDEAPVIAQVEASAEEPKPWHTMDVKERLECVRMELALQNDILSTAKGNLTQLYEMEKVLINEHAALYPPMSQAALIKQVTKAQREAKMVKANLTSEVHAQLRAKGVKPNFPSIVRSPLDTAMQRRTGYGHMRPVFAKNA